MKASERGYFAPLSYDLRVRERLLAAGVVTPADIQQYLAGLPDDESHSESLGIPQPALAAPQPPAPAAPPAPAPVRVAAPAPAAPALADDDDDDDEDDDDDVAAGPEESAPAAIEAAEPPTQTIAVGEPAPTHLAHEIPEAAKALLEEAAPVAEAAPAETAPVAAESVSSSDATNQSTEEQAG